MAMFFYASCTGGDYAEVNIHTILDQRRDLAAPKEFSRALDPAIWNRDRES